MDLFLRSAVGFTQLSDYHLGSGPWLLKTQSPRDRSVRAGPLDTRLVLPSGRHHDHPHNPRSAGYPWGKIGNKGKGWIKYRLLWGRCSPRCVWKWLKLVLWKRILVSRAPKVKRTKGATRMGAGGGEWRPWKSCGSPGGGRSSIPTFSKLQFPL